MDPQQIKEMLLALKLELVRYKGLCVIAFILVSSGILGLGLVWPQTYETSAVLHADETNIIEPLLKGRAEMGKIDRSQSAKEIIYTRQFLVEVLKESEWTDENTSAEKVESLVKVLRGTVKIEPAGKEYFRVTYATDDQDKSYDTLTSTVNTFIAYTTRQKKEESYAAYKFIDSQVQAYKQQLEDAEENLKNFKSANTEGSEEAVTRRLSQLRSEIEALELTREETKSKIDTLKKQINTESSYLQVRSRLDQLEERKSTLMHEIETLRLTYQENYPDVVSLKMQIHELNRVIEDIYLHEGLPRGGKGGEGTNPLFEELRIQLSVAEVDYKAQNQRLGSLNRLLEREQLRAEKVASNEAKLSELTRDYDVTKNVYEEMLGRKENARLSMVLDLEGQGVSFQIHEPAIYPLSSVGLKFIHFAVIGPIIGFLFPIVFLIAYIVVDPRIRAASQVEKTFSEYGFFSAVPYCYTAIGARILRRDAILIILVAIFFVIGYAGFVARQILPTLSL